MEFHRANIKHPKALSLKTSKGKAWEKETIHSLMFLQIALPYLQGGTKNYDSQNAINLTSWIEGYWKSKVQLNENAWLITEYMHVLPLLLLLLWLVPLYSLEGVIYGRNGGETRREVAPDSSDNGSHYFVVVALSIFFFCILNFIGIFFNFGFSVGHIHILYI